MLLLLIVVGALCRFQPPHNQGHRRIVVLQIIDKLNSLKTP
jgi:hypothetical protein